MGKGREDAHQINTPLDITSNYKTFFFFYIKAQFWTNNVDLRFAIAFVNVNVFIDL